MITDSIKEIEVWTNEIVASEVRSSKYDIVYTRETAIQIATNLGVQGIYSYFVYVTPYGAPNSPLDIWLLNGLETALDDIRDCYSVKCPYSSK